MLTLDKPLPPPPPPPPGALVGRPPFDSHKPLIETQTKSKTINYYWKSSDAFIEFNAFLIVATKRKKVLRDLGSGSTRVGIFRILG